MTHDELLTDLNGFIYESEMQNKSDTRFLKALRAVVELHKPMTTGKWCGGCSQSSSEFNRMVRDMEFAAAVYVLYPCPTIQKIEEELNGKP